MNWTSLVESYLLERRQLGYSLVSEGHYLQNFAQFAERQRVTSLTVALALGWANLAPSGSDIAIARRFSLLRPFSRYLSCRGYDSVLLPTHFIGPTHRRLPPFIFHDSDIIRLMSASDKLIPLNGLRPDTIKTLIGLLAASGLRPGEAVRLQTEDVNLKKGELTILNSKGWKQRVIPISPTATVALQAYFQRREALNPLSLTGFFFEFDNCQPLNIRSADYAFKVIRKAIGLPVKLNGQRPRLYDLRHTFVCRRVIDWYRTGENINNRIAQLSHYLGHKKVSDTYWYITAIPELMACAANKVKEIDMSGGSL